MRYRLTVRGRLGPDILTMLEDLAVEREDHHESSYMAELSDQADLFGLLGLIQSIGIELVSITEVSFDD